MVVLSRMLSGCFQCNGCRIALKRSFNFEGSFMHDFGILMKDNGSIHWRRYYRLPECNLAGLEHVRKGRFSQLG